MLQLIGEDEKGAGQDCDDNQKVGGGSFHLVPIPVTPQHLRVTEPLWFPFLERISTRSGEPVDSLFNRIMSGEVQPILVWNGKEARALCGVRFYMRGDEKIAQWVWQTGTGRKDWEHLISDMEDCMRFYGVALCEAVCRKGWTRILKKYGYETVGQTEDDHIKMEKRL